MERILAIGAHPDDIEHGCGGTLVKYSPRNTKITALFMTKGGERGNEEERVRESISALFELGVVDVIFKDFKDTRLFEDLNESILVIEKFCQEFNPDRVYTTSSHDSHQDHQAVHQAAIVACRSVPQVLCYETPSTMPTFTPSIFEDITLSLETKIIALEKHTSQKSAAYMSREALTIRAKFWGLMVSVKSVEAAEAFESHRLILK